MCFKEAYIKPKSKTKPECKICNGKGKVLAVSALIPNSNVKMKYVPCTCKTHYSIGDAIHTEKENKDLILKNFIKSMKHKKHIEFGSLEEFYDHIPSFIEYPTLFLPELARKFEHELEDIDDIKQLIGLLKIDDYVLSLAYYEGIHPITGVKWDYEDEKRYKLLRKRNIEMRTYLESMVKVLETKY